MHVLICDDDPSTRFVVKRLLTQNFGCTTTECGDGVEALVRLDEEETDMVMLDVEMPQLDGVEVLEAIRASDLLKTMPVVMMSRERREEVVVKLVRFGIDGYILKPLRTEKVLAALEPLRAKLASRKKRVRPGQSQAIHLSPDSPAMLVDGNLDYRHFFVSQSQKQGPVIQAASGAAALGQFRQNPVRFVFVGTQLGVLSAELLLPKLRALAGSQGLRIIGILDAAGLADASGLGFDDVMFRSYIPDKFKSELRKFAKVPGPLAAVTKLVGDLGHGLVSATQQVFGMMLDAETEVADDPVEKAPLVGAISDIQIEHRYIMALKIFATVPSMTAITARMLSMGPEEVTDEDYLSTGAELANLISGRIHAVLDEKSVVSECSLPKVQSNLKDWVPEGIEDVGALKHFRIPALSAGIYMSLEVRDLLGESDSTPAEDSVVGENAA
jgi:two-component system, chemotaxis family, chemotaxis protein CheY